MNLWDDRFGTGVLASVRQTRAAGVARALATNPKLLLLDEKACGRHERAGDGGTAAYGEGTA